jgi:hypothetical protein
MLIEQSISIQQSKSAIVLMRSGEEPKRIGQLSVQEDLVVQVRAGRSTR